MGIYRLPKIIGKYNKPSFGARINRHHPLSQGLVGAWLFNEGAGKTSYDVSGIHPGNFVVISGSPSWLGGDCLFNANNSYIHYPLGSLSFTDFSVVYSFTPYSFIDYNNIITALASGDAQGSYNHDAFSNYCTSTNTFSVGVGGTRCVYGGATTYTRYTVVYTNKNKDANLYVNGKFIQNKTQANPLTWVAFQVGTSNNYTINGLYHFLYIYNRSLLSTEAISFYANPYQIFLHPVWDTYIIPAAAPPPTGGKSIFGYDSIFHAGGIIQT